MSFVWITVIALYIFALVTSYLPTIQYLGRRASRTGVMDLSAGEEYVFFLFTAVMGLILVAPFGLIRVVKHFSLDKSCV
jgi:hypothetical protein